MGLVSAWGIGSLLPLLPRITSSATPCTSSSCWNRSSPWSVKIRVKISTCASRHCPALAIPSCSPICQLNTLFTSLQAYKVSCSEPWFLYCAARPCCSPVSCSRSASTLLLQHLLPPSLPAGGQRLLPSTPWYVPIPILAYTLLLLVWD